MQCTHIHAFVDGRCKGRDHCVTQSVLFLKNVYRHYMIAACVSRDHSFVQHLEALGK